MAEAKVTMTTTVSQQVADEFKTRCQSAHFGTHLTPTKRLRQLVQEACGMEVEE